jgi:HD superfamily phosphodiesterase
LASSITERILAAEENWLDLVRIHTTRLFSETFIPSHDHGHHQRVWNICKKLLIELESYSSTASKDLVEGILLAAWFHDTGMVRDIGVRHGALSREMFETFIRNTSTEEPKQYKEVLEQYREVLDAIEYHDTKERSAYPDINPGTSPGILGILSMADDLDALGNIGIYRYLEIYLKRGIPVRELGTKILSNVQRRFKNIRESCAALPRLIDPYRESYRTIEKFFELYNKQLLTEEEPDSVHRGYLGIANLIRSLSVESEIRPENFINQPELTTGGEIVKKYFNELHNELE